MFPSDVAQNLNRCLVVLYADVAHSFSILMLLKKLRRFLVVLHSDVAQKLSSNWTFTILV